MTLGDVVREHMHDTMAYVFATAGTAKAIQDDLTKKASVVKPGAGRRTLAVGPATMPPSLPKSWLMVALVHDDKDVAAVAGWAKGKDLARIHFYFSTDVDLFTGMKPWATQDLPAPGDVANYGPLPAFRREIGIKINERIRLDHS